MRVRLFARLRELGGSGEFVRDVPDGATVSSVWQSLVEDFPGFADYRPSLSCAVNAEYAKFTTAVADGDEVAFMPPVSGG
ncbi:MAG: MoaD/ThiS family protein [Vicinamibacterales bacterium]